MLAANPVLSETCLRRNFRCAASWCHFYLPSARAHFFGQEVRPNWPIPSELKREAINGYPRAYRDAGEGTPIVLVHGSTNDYRIWNAQSGSKP
jgi:hypothetical protein